MPTSSRGRDEAQSELETWDRSDSLVIEKPDGSSRSLAASRTDIDDLDDGVSSVNSASSKIHGNHSDVD